ncbi:MAG: hypothetical protein CGU28_10290 [Candidatus Dactylopiibacterium carminicum]|uniref:Zinc finger DksA/TraR C4-type domain-containing protein n=1 Tax=Candidatus Dactylopiibacterium carminicum TaxID=857335 RepID=A0A272ERZ2_9RHOO|nr:TraR/DksA C4-type zinc finger protein [Candidatus Dactylopiibacterium carminicum]KAF7600711.1 hypothetical protein BGI27_00990 [Candidatus Dactylopiibacterium carminicum]PAS92470.1 MAG: hypothetical protein CGU29_11375 [Candidatus Dactylopiibacterium carminicum]PAS96040.1 MAG: hypothetical protein CGU28_10290 [Candidatus Dactylopiibacterium carminicum]PAT00717.1 MAG: hypothetical protein BSR46_01000 [Candidatus Dactylopiibacterium carminicum]
MNPADIAQDRELEEWSRPQSEAAQHDTELPAAFFCEDCEIEIPPERRDAQPGCTRCAACQADYESLKKRGLAA